VAVYDLRSQQYNLPKQRRAIALYSSVGGIEGAKGGLGMAGNGVVK
jgi:hypothetical protein